MSKRDFGRFSRRERDFYPTPEAAVPPLLPYLARDGIKTFVEPCYGDGSLARHLEMHGLQCLMSADIDGDEDWVDAACDWTSTDYTGADCVITNPPWRHATMAGIMLHQSSFIPCWFLIYWDWLSNVRAAPIIRERITDVVPIGRLKWIPNTTRVGFDNCCWVRLSVDKEPDLPVHLWPRG